MCFSLLKFWFYGLLCAHCVFVKFLPNSSQSCHHHFYGRDTVLRPLPSVVRPAGGLGRANIIKMPQ